MSVGLPLSALLPPPHRRAAVLLNVPSSTQFCIASCVLRPGQKQVFGCCGHMHRHIEEVRPATGTPPLFDGEASQSHQKGFPRVLEESRESTQQLPEAWRRKQESVVADQRWPYCRGRPVLGDRVSPLRRLAMLSSAAARRRGKCALQDLELEAGAMMKNRANMVHRQIQEKSGKMMRYVFIKRPTPVGHVGIVRLHSETMNGST